MRHLAVEGAHCDHRSALLYRLSKDGRFVLVKVASEKPPPEAGLAEALLEASVALEPRFVELGRKYGDNYEVKSGVKENERVVTSANFLIDAEAKVQGALKSW